MVKTSKEETFKQSILLVEDDEALIEAYSSRLIAEGYEVSSVTDGEEALSEIIKMKPNLVILDVMMPKIDGFEVLDILRNTAETVNTKIIMLTALSRPEDIEKAQQYGVDDYFIKSQVTLNEVIDRIKKHLSD